MALWITLFALFLILLLLISFSLTRRRDQKGEEGNHPYLEGLKHLLDGEKEEALQQLKLAVSLDTSNVDAYIRLGDLLRRNGKSDRALQLHLSLMVRPGISKREKGSIARSIAEDYVQLRDPQKAISTLKKWVAENPKDFHAKEDLLSLYEEQKLWKEAYRLQKEILERKKPFDTLLLALYRAYIGEDCMKEGKLQEAREALREALKLDRNCVPAILYLGDLSYSSGRIEDAIEYWRRILKETPHYAPLVFSRLEKAYFDRGRFSELEKIFEELVDQSPEDTRTLFAQAEIYQKKGKDEDAVRIYEKILELKPDPSRTRSALSGLLEISLKRKNLEESRRHAKALSELLSIENEVYACSNCGFESKEHLWRCPSCSEWTTFLPPSHAR